jgi:hypothetical protein
MASDFPQNTELVVRAPGGSRAIRTLDEALAYLRTTNAGEHANRTGVLFRLEGAHDPEERIDAANAFRGWLDATGLLIEARPAR